MSLLPATIQPSRDQPENLGKSTTRETSSQENNILKHISICHRVSLSSTWEKYASASGAERWIHGEIIANSLSRPEMHKMAEMANL